MGPGRTMVMNIFGLPGSILMMVDSRPNMQAPASTMR